MRLNDYMRVRTVLLLLCLWTAGTPVSADTVSDVDSLLRIYDRSQGDKHLSVGRQLLQIYGSSSVFFNDVPAISADMNRKEQDLTVWFGTERFYTTNSYYTTSTINSCWWCKSNYNWYCS